MRTGLRFGFDYRSVLSFSLPDEKNFYHYQERRVMNLPLDADHKRELSFFSVFQRRELIAESEAAGITSRRTFR